MLELAEAPMLIKTPTRLRVALVGHACSPKLGSEPGLTWNWAKNLAAFHDVEIFCHPQYRQHVDAYLAENPVDSLCFQWVESESRFDPWRPNRGERGLRLHYGLWQRAVLRRVQQSHHIRAFDVVHHVCWGSLNQPPLLWKLGVPFVWGPVGGGQMWPSRFLRYSDSPRKEKLRGLAVRGARFKPSVRAAARHSAIALAKNNETADLLRLAGAKDVRTYMDNGVCSVEGSPDRDVENGKLRLLWAGRCEPRKGLPLLLEALTQCAATPWTLTIAGDGPMRDAWQKRTSALGIEDRVLFLGSVPWIDMPELFKKHHTIVFPSLRDATGSVVLEAMAWGMSVITLDHQGIGSYVTPEFGIKIPVVTPGETTASIAAAVMKLAGDAALRRRLAEGALEQIKQELWPQKARQMAAIYEEAVRAHRSV